MQFKAHIKKCNSLLTSLFTQTKVKPITLKSGYNKFIYRVFTVGYSLIPRAKHLLRAVLDIVEFYCESARE